MKSDDDDDWDDDGINGRRPEKKLRIEDVTEDAIVRDALMQEEAEKASKNSKGKQAPGHGGKHEEEEGGSGPVKESLVKTALNKRALDRKRRHEMGDKDLGPEDLDLPDEVGAYEVDRAEVQEEGGVKIIPFSFKDDKEAGEFDEEGNFIEKKLDRGERDAWLDSGEAQVVSDKVREVVESRQHAMRAADDEEERKKAAPMTDRQIATIKMELARSMLPEESVGAALKRVRGAGGGGAGKVKRDQRREIGAGGGGAGGNMELFLRMTEIVDLLFSEGETEIFTSDKGELEKSAAMWLPKPKADSVAPSKYGKEKIAIAGDDNDDDDMFGDGDGQAKKEKGSVVDGIQLIKGAALQPQAASKTSDEAPGTDYSSWPVKEVVRFLKENGVDASGIVEKGELVDLAHETERRLREEADEALKGSAEAPANPPPAGFVYDPSSRFYHNVESQMYFDGASGAFWDGTQWLSHDGKSYVPL